MESTEVSAGALGASSRRKQSILSDEIKKQNKKDNSSRGPNPPPRLFFLNLHDVIITIKLLIVNKIIELQSTTRPDPDPSQL